MDNIPLKAVWEVQAGILPGEPMPEYTKRFYYTSGDNAADQELPEQGTNRFTEKMLEAHKYAQEITDPSRVNWVRIDFVWT
jgi:hypothetical protein